MRCINRHIPGCGIFTAAIRNKLLTNGWQLLILKIQIGNKEVKDEQLG